MIMSIKEVLKKSTIVLKSYSVLREAYYKTLTSISPKLNVKARYKSVHKKELDLNNPKTFSEKLLWLKLNRYNYDPQVIQCADKVLVRDYVKDCGCEDILNELLGVWDTPDEIPWDELPQRFALKWNFGAGMNIICKDKDTLNRQTVVAQMKKWGKSKSWLDHAELQYKYIPKKILCEKFIECPDQAVIPDYKVYCFNGKPQAILVMHDRGQTVKGEFFDTQWESLPTPEKYEKPTIPTPKPECLHRLLEISEKLSAPFPFVRCDFYIVGRKIYFGELTFTPASGLYTSETTIHGKSMADFLEI